MKKNKIYNIKIIVIIFLIIIGMLGVSGCISNQEKTIKVSGAFALYPLMNIWAEKYQELYPNIKIEVSAGGAGKGMSDAIKGYVDIGMVSRSIYTAEINQGIFWVSVAKDAVVGTISSNNPIKNIILEKGMSREQLESIFIKGTVTNWGQLYDDSSITEKIHVYTRSDSCGAAEEWAKFLGDYTQDDLTNALVSGITGSGINGDPNLAAAVKNDERGRGIGYNNINFIYDSDTKEPFEGLLPIPIDLNENGVLDQNESFYDNITSIVNAIANNIYPSPPARELHLVTKNQFDGEVKSFVNWILTEGQNYVTESGYIQLSEENISNQITYLEEGIRPEIR